MYILLLLLLFFLKRISTAGEFLPTEELVYFYLCYWKETLEIDRNWTSTVDLNTIIMTLCWHKTPFHTSDQ